ncbi:MAG TPA: RNA polymerase sigma factor [Burkholderiales bacterium]|nr:RNA polymerase sigma factor [Burkholderiales bacterium]
MSWSAESSDEELMLLYRDGDASAFDALYARHRGGLYRYLLRQCRNQALAEELFQDVWMNLIRARSSYTVQAKFTTYLYRLAHNRFVDHYRKQGHVELESFDAEDGPVLEELADDRNPPPAAAYDAKRQAAELLSLITELPPTQREAFLLQQEGGMSVEEIAATTGVSRETAKSRLRYAIAKLRQGMSKWH